MQVQRTAEGAVMATVLASTRDRQMLAATSAELDQAQQVVDDLGAHASRQLSMNRTVGQEPIEIPRELSAVVAQILTIVARGGTVTIGSMPEELTTSTAAEQLGVSRPTLMKMIEHDEIPAHRVGTHTRLKSTDVMAFRKERQIRRRAAFDSLRDLEERLA